MTSAPHIVGNFLRPKTYLRCGRIVESAANPGMKALLQSCGERAFRFAFGLTGNIEEAKDLVQEAFRRLLLCWEQVELTRSADLLFTVLRNLCVDAGRLHERRNFISLDAPLDAGSGEGPVVADRLASDEVGPLEQLEREEDFEWLRLAMEGLNPDFRQVLELGGLEGRSYEEIARQVGCPIGTVRSRMSRARLAVRVSIERKKAAR